MSINNTFSKIFCISLKKREDRRIKIKNHLDLLNIDFDFFDAIDGREIKNLPTNINPGEMGCILSHLEIYKKAASEKLGNYLIIEDDCEFDIDVNNKFIEYYSEVPQDWKLIYFGGNHNGTQFKMTSPHVHRLHRTYTTHCYGVRDGFSEILISEIENKIKNIKQIDVELSDIQTKYPCYGFIPHIAWQYDGFSDIVGDYRNYDFLKKDGRPC